MHANTRVLSLLLFAAVTPLFSEVALLVGEPFGKFGALNPTGHAAIYLSGVCAESPIKLRLCRPGDTGVVISRYNRIAGYDWIAVPLVPYLYAVERPEDVPASADDLAVARLREGYRRSHLWTLVPSGPENDPASGDWTQLAGAAYDRTIYGFALETTPEDDARLVRYLNSKPNRKRFNLLYRNCADFARGILNFYYPRALRRSRIADAGITTPKHSAKTLVNYCRRRPGLRLSQFVIPQVPGGRPSKKLRGVSESLVWSKKYVAPLLLFQPWVAATAAAAYLSKGRFDPARHCETVCEPGTLESCISGSGTGTIAASADRPARLSRD